MKFLNTTTTIQKPTQALIENTPPIYALQDPEEIRMLTRALEDPTPLHQAIHTNDLESVQARINAGADVNIRNAQQETPLQTAIHNVAILTCLLQAGANVHLKNNKGWTALHFAAAYGTPEVIALLVQAGAKLDQRNNDNESPLLLTLPHYKEMNARTLIALGAKLNDFYNGAHFLHYVVTQPLKDLVPLLIEKGVSINVQDNLGRTALHMVVILDIPHMAQFLLAQGASKHIKDYYHHTATDYVLSKANPQMLEVFEIHPWKTRLSSILSTLTWFLPTTKVSSQPPPTVTLQSTPPAVIIQSPDHIDVQNMSTETTYKPELT